MRAGIEGGRFYTLDGAGGSETGGSEIGGTGSGAVSCVTGAGVGVGGGASIDTNIKVGT